MELGTYLYGPGGVEEKAIISGAINGTRLPDVICKERCRDSVRNLIII